MTVISVIVGSTRQGRFSERPAEWIPQHRKKRSGVDARLLDLRDYPMPFFDQPVSPATPGRPPYEHAVVKSWTAAIAASDGFVVVTPEYNYGPSAVLKNAIDWVYPEWNRKAVGFVSYGSAMGARGVMAGAVFTHLFIVGGSAMPATVLLIGSLAVAWARREQLASMLSKRS